MQRYQVITNDDLMKIHENSMKIMSEVGIVMPYDHAKELLAKHGATIDGDVVRFPRALVEEAIKTAPDSYTMYSRDGKHDVDISTEKTAYAGPYGSPFVTDMDRGRRSSTLQDFIDIVKIVDNLENVDIQSHISCEPSDIEEADRPLTMVYNTVRNSAKPGMGSIFGYETSKKCIELAALPFGGLDSIPGKAIIASIPCTLTPLSYDPRQLGAIRAYAELGQVQLINSLSIAGMTTPTTLVGLVSLQNAEVLAGITYAQLVNPGCPVVYSASGSNAEMSSGGLCIGSPEDAIVSLINGQLCKYYQIPCRISGALSDSKMMDTQAAYESAVTISAAQMAGGNFILHAAGIIETYTCTSFEKLIIDNEVLGYFKRIGRGVEVNDETLAYDVIKNVGPQGTFITEEHTLMNFRDEFYMPKLSDRLPYSRWKAAGSLSAEQRANAKFKQILAEHPEPTVDAELDADMKKFVEKELGHAI